MRKREDILLDLIQYRGNLLELEREISQYPWDVDIPLLVISGRHLVNVIKKCIDQIITLKDLENWANILECRDDLDFEESKIQEIIFELANPDINGEITTEKLIKFRAELESHQLGL